MSLVQTSSPFSFLDVFLERSSFLFFAALGHARIAVMILCSFQSPCQGWGLLSCVLEVSQPSCCWYQTWNEILKPTIAIVFPIIPFGCLFFSPVGFPGWTVFSLVACQLLHHCSTIITDQGLLLDIFCFLDVVWNSKRLVMTPTNVIC